MKIVNSILFACVGLFAAGCALSRPNVTLAPMGPAPEISSGSSSAEGWLVVYSDWVTAPPGEQDDVIVDHPSDYEVLSPQGKRVKQVDNFVGTFVDDPARVALLRGRYTVIAKATSYGKATVPVVIETGKTTYVHLDGSPMRTKGEGSDGDVMRLPDGSIVGLRAQEATN